MEPLRRLCDDFVLGRLFSCLISPPQPMTLNGTLETLVLLSGLSKIKKISILDSQTNP
jgi:hypothetical protein